MFIKKGKNPQNAINELAEWAVQHSFYARNLATCGRNRRNAARHKSAVNKELQTKRLIKAMDSWQITVRQSLRSSEGAAEPLHLQRAGQLRSQCAMGAQLFHTSAPFPKALLWSACWLGSYKCTEGTPRCIISQHAARYIETICREKGVLVRCGAGSVIMWHVLMISEEGKQSSFGAFAA